jgi:hypothetical protein
VDDARFCATHDRDIAIVGVEVKIWLDKPWQYVTRNECFGGRMKQSLARQLTVDRFRYWLPPYHTDGRYSMTSRRKIKRIIPNVLEASAEVCQHVSSLTTTENAERGWTWSERGRLNDTHDRGWQHVNSVVRKLTCYDLIMFKKRNHLHYFTRR